MKIPFKKKNLSMRSSDISVIHNGFFFLFITIKLAQEKFCI